MHSLWQDFYFGLRLLRKTPVLAAIIVLTLGLGIGINTIAFSWVYTVLFYPLRGVNTDISRQVIVMQKAQIGEDGHEISFLDLQDLISHQEIFAGAAGDHEIQLNMKVDHQIDWVWAQVVTPGFFDFYGIKAQFGRTFLPEEEKPGNGAVAVLSHKLWKNRFGSNPQVLGKVIELNHSSLTVVGIAPPEFRGSQAGLSNDIWIPLSMAQQIGRGDLLASRWGRGLKATARLQTGITLEQAQAVARSVSEWQATTYPNSNKDFGLQVRAYTDAPYSLQGFLRLFKVFLLAVCLLLCIIVANLTNLVLARSASRRQEISIRLALGAGRFRLFRQFLAESLVLTLAGALLGLSLSFWGADLLLFFIPPTHLPVDTELLPMFRWNILAYILLIALAVGIAMGMAQTLQNRPSKVQSTLKEGGRSSSTHSSSHRLSNLLVMTEMALAVMVLVGAGLCAKSLKQSLAIHPGFDPSNILLAGVKLTPGVYAKPQGQAFFQRVQEKIQALPGVEAVSLADWTPLGFEGGPRPWVQIEGYQPQRGEDMGANHITVSPGYFKTMRIPLLEGRDFRPDESRLPLNSAIINQALAERFWPGRSPLGRHLQVNGKKCIVVGMAGNCKYRKLSEPQQPGIYLNSSQNSSPGMALHVRSQSDSPSLLALIQKEVYAVDPQVKLNGAAPLVGFMQASYCQEKMLTVLLTGVGLIALVLACLGIYGVLNWSVSQRLGEIGIRMALGASSWKVLKMILLNGAALMGTGVALGILAALYLSHNLTAFLAGVSPKDPLIYGAVCGLLWMVGWLACFLPARRAASLEPMSVLRGE